MYSILHKTCWIFILGLCSSCYGATHQEASNQKNIYLSHFKEVSGRIEIDEGVILIHDHLRLQAKKIFIENSLTKDTKVLAQGNILVTFQGKTLLCDYFEYDDTTDSCLLTNGKFALYPWFIGGSTMTLSPESILINKGYISTSEGPKKDVILIGDSLEYTSNNILSIGTTILRIKNIPVLCLPSFSFSPLEIPKPPISFRGGSGGFLGSYLGVSYAPISHKNIHSNFLIDSFFKHGIGCGYNFFYKDTKNQDNYFLLNSYYAHRLAIDMAQASDRYRIHNKFAFSKQKIQVQGQAHLTDSWETSADFFPNNFSLQNTEVSNLIISWQEANIYSALTTSVKLNSFQSVNQELPSIMIRHLPMTIKGLNLVFENTAHCSYLSYAFSKAIPGNHFSSARLSWVPKIHKYIRLPIGNLTTTLKSNTIYYYQLPENYNQNTQFIGFLDVDYKCTFFKKYPYFKHIIEPFVSYSGSTKPLLNNEEHYIFSTEDAYHSLNMIKTGFHTTVFHLYKHHQELFKTTLYFSHVINPSISVSTFPKIRCLTKIPFSLSSKLLLDAEWLLKLNTWDHINLTWEWIDNPNFAISTEFSHRSKYSWLKCDKEDYTLDIYRSTDELLNSPLSNRRNLLLTKIFLRPNPGWSYKFSMRHGWLRDNEPSFLEYQAVVTTKIFEHWQLYSVFEHREADNRVFFFLKIDSPKKQRSH